MIGRGGASPSHQPSSADDIAIAHWGEHLNSGADRVAWELQRTFDAPLYVGYRNPDIEPDDVTDVRQLFDGPVAERAIEHGGALRALTYLVKWAVDAAPVRELWRYDTVITAGNETLFYCSTDTQTHIHYVHHTSRRHTDLLDEWPDSLGGDVGRAYAFLVRQLMGGEVSRPDLFVANSEVVARRVNKYWGVPREKITVVYPPVPTHEFSSATAPTKDYYLTLSRLDWHKNIDGIIEAFNQHPELRLLVAGDGPERGKLEAMAGDNVEFLGYVTEDEKRRLLAEAKAFVSNGREEDFGIASVEPIAAGTPLLGVREGFTRYLVIDGKNGYTHVRPDERGPSIVDTLERFEREGVEWDESRIAEFAERFSVDAFRRGVRAAVTQAQERREFRPDWYDDLVSRDEE